MSNIATIARQAPMRVFDEDQVDLIKRTICKGASDDELKLFMYQAERTGLDPLARQIYAVKRWDAMSGREVMSIQTSIDGFRLVAQRSGEYGGQVGPFWCGKDGKWKDVWISKDHPVAARVGIWREGFKEPCWGVARFDAYAQRKKDKTLTRMWESMGDVMIAKCAEALGLRKAFPQELSGLYTSDEMDQSITETTSKPVEPAKIAPKQIEAPHDPDTGEIKPPHPISAPHKEDSQDPDWIGYGSLILAAIKTAKDKNEIDEWLDQNNHNLTAMETDAPKVYKRLMSAIGK